MQKVDSDSKQAQSKGCVRINKQIERMKKNVTSIKRKPTPIFTLNFDCLLEIFKLLRIDDQLHFAMTCKDLLNFYCQEIAPQCKKISSIDLWYLIRVRKAHLKRFFKATAEFIHEIDFYDTPQSVYLFDILLRYARNVKKLNMKGLCDTVHELLPILLAHGQSVEVLSLSDCRLTDAYVEQLQRLPKLRALRLDFNFELTGKYLAHHSDLEELYLDCTALKAEYVQEIAQSCRKLRILDIGRFEMDPKTCHLIAENCQKLETLCFREADVDCSALGRLPNLRRLSLDAVRTSFLSAFAQYKQAEQLEDLRIMNTHPPHALIKSIMQFKNLKILWLQARWQTFKGNDFSGSMVGLSKLEKLEKLAILNNDCVRDDELFSILKGCPNLRHMGLFWCQSVTATFVFTAIEVLKQRSAERKAQYKSARNPFMLIVHGTQIVDTIKYDKRLTEASSVLDLYILPMYSTRCIFFQEKFPFENGETENCDKMFYRKYQSLRVRY